jgi:UDP-N-acetylmuramoylalanine--D-glutamate ligase
MTTSEHLDYHKNIHEYVDAKRNILRFQSASDAAIVNKDYPASNESKVHTQGKVFQVSRIASVQNGCFVENGKITVRVRNSGRLPTISTEIINVKDILLPGKHNLENVCAAVMAALLSGVSKENIVAVLKTFKGLEHRLELIRQMNGVRFYDDSFSTIPETTIAAIEAFKNPEILILGGSSKNSDFKELGRVISEAQNIKAIIGIGVEWPRIKKSIGYQVSGIKYVESCKNMREIVQKAHQLAKPGDVVLLSPACASFDMFKNYKDRGDQFKEEIKKLKN